MYAQTDTEQLKNALDLRTLVTRFWGDPARRHPQYDVHYARWRSDGHKPAFTVYAAYFVDYGGAGERGDVFTFLQRELNISFSEAVAWLRADLHLPTAELARSARAGQPAATMLPLVPPLDWQAAAQHALAAAQAYLWSERSDAHRVRAYLRDVRGLTDATIRAAGYGYQPQWQPVDWLNPATGKPAYLAPGIIEPWTMDGTLWALRVRCRVGNLAAALGQPDDIGREGDPLPKYLNLAGSRQNGALYNGDALQPGAPVLLVEGGFDARLAQQTLGPGWTVVTFGSASATPSATQIARLRQAGTLVLLLDNDAAGQQAQTRLLELLCAPEAAAPAILTATLPHGKDVTDFVQAGGDLGGLLHERLRAAAGQGWWPQGVPDTVRALLLTYLPESAALCIELLNQAAQQGWLDARHFTVEDALTAAQRSHLQPSASSLRRALRLLDGHFLSKQDPVIDSDSKINPPDFEKNPAPLGRRAARYRLLPRADAEKALLRWAAPRLWEQFHPADAQGVVALPRASLFEALGWTAGEAAALLQDLGITAAFAEAHAAQAHRELAASERYGRALTALRQRLSQPHSTPLPTDTPLTSPLLYRAALLRATNDPAQRRSRKQMQQLLGVADSSLGRLVEAAGLAATVPNGEYEDQELRHAHHLEAQIAQAARAVNGYPRAIIIEQPNGRHVYCDWRDPAALERVTAALDAPQPRRVWVRCQVANRYETVTETIVQPVYPVRAAAPAEAAPPETEPEASVSTASPRSRRRRFYGVGLDPAWALAQVHLALLRAGRLALHRRAGGDVAWVDTATGEVTTPLRWLATARRPGR